MDAWELWIVMAQEASETAQSAETAGHLRSAASRYYYAAYQAATALLLYRGLMPPINREAWGHFQTPILLKEETETLITSRGRRNNIAVRLNQLYDLRLIADYQAGRRISQAQITTARRDSSFLLKVVNDILPEKLL